MGKTVVLREETVKCTARATGVRVPASVERRLEITTGRSLFPAGTDNDPRRPVVEGETRRRAEELGLAHEPVVATMGE